MVGGQMRDLNAASEAVNLSELEDLHRRKTGALIRASTIMGGIAGGSDNDTELDAWGNYASALGLAFQIHDDILDVEAPTETLGKTQGADARLNKPTYVTIAGLDRAKALAKQQVDAAIAALDNFGQRASRLHQLAHYIVERHY